MAGIIRNKIAWVVFAFLAMGVGLYPFAYWMTSEKFGLLSSKTTELLANEIWTVGFYGHITFGAFALMSGWSQFSKKIRSRNLKLHRNLGKVYVFSVLISGICGVYIAFFATGGLITSLGFLGLGIIWLFTTLKAYFAIRAKDLALHQGMMIYSYAACFAAVTLRLWLPLLTMAFGEFLIAYKIVAWLCWVPNMIFAFFWVKRKGLTLV
ncbi:hypothetical protein DKG77_07235 [Flagellimonas aquimarina]|jgi:uncharacterized membrane protein|uniref:DUF2306 domain-containing protein n=1 Tax=Flagellimonas aquimarina TaxID=2201895 RepID=A0A316KYA6_9FLAO|nr:DUF2306 domain-containing protein [Allomuricauda koreensis]PWL38078.1 hypothetical protein DKG77_07235 [Allomuricauda koreensis]